MGLDAAVVTGRCLSYGEGITYWPVVAAVKELLAGSAAPNATIAALLGEGQAPADEIAIAVRRLFEAAAADRPLVVVFDDIQWGEPTFLDLIEHIGDWSRDAPILLLCLARPELLELRPSWGGGKLNATAVLLEPLSAAETDELIDELLDGRGLDPALRERIRASAEGNPLFVEQMLAMVEESPEQVTVPSTIQALLAARLDQLPASERAALERGAVEGQVFHGSAVAALAPDDPDIPARLLGLVRKELVRPSQATLPGDDAFRFRHLLIRDAAYDSLPKSARAELHESFAGWLEGRVPDLVELDEILGYHLEQAARFRAELGTASPALEERSARHLAAAGVRAAEREDPAACVTLLRRACAFLERGDPRRAELLAVQGQALFALGRLEEAYRAFDEAISGDNPDISARAFFLKTFAWGLGESISPFELERDAAEILAPIESTASDETVAAAYVTIGWARYWQGRLGAATEAGKLAVVRASRARKRLLELEGLRLVSAGIHHGDAPWAEVERWVRERPGVPGAAHLLAASASLQGRTEEARQILDQHARDESERGRVMSTLTMSASRGEIEMVVGEYDLAEQILRRGWDGLGDVGERGIRSTVGGCLGEALARLGRLDEAESLLDEALGISTPDDWVTVSQVQIGRAFVASGRGEDERACDLAREAVEIVDTREYVTIQQQIRLHNAEILVAAARNGEARFALEQAREVAARKGSTVLIVRADELLAELDARP